MASPKMRLAHATRTFLDGAVLAFQDLTLDVRLGGYERTILLRVVKIQKGGDIFLLVAGARKGRFAGLVEEFRRSFDSFKVQEEKAE